MALTKTVAAVDEWESIAQNAVREGATVDVSNAYAAALHIDIALTSATAHTGTKISVQVSSNSTGDEDWSTLTEFIGPTGTANTENITNNPLAAGSFTATCASTTGLYDDDETRWIYIKDATIANSEMVWLVSHVAATSVTWADGTANAHVQNTPMWDIADRFVVDIPIWVSRVRVHYDNTFDSDGATCDTACRVSAVTGL
ncbi:MAG: hypothetical protein ACXABY_11980 [Candidatus Thorarchaeota archaeon]|jgi:hypothetical protein